MATATPCQTPGAVFHTYLTPASVTVAVDLPSSLDLTHADAAQLEADLHNVVELVLARWWPGVART